MVNIAAYTDSHSILAYPSYISINHNDDRAANGERTNTDIMVSVRSKATADGREGSQAVVQLSRSECKRIVLALLAELLKG